MSGKVRKERVFLFDRVRACWHGPRRTRSDPKGVVIMAGAATGSLVHQFASMKATEFGPAIEPKWQLAERLVKEVRTAVEKQHLTPLDGARVISSITATLFATTESSFPRFRLKRLSPPPSRGVKDRARPNEEGGSC